MTWRVIAFHPCVAFPRNYDQGNDRVMEGLNFAFVVAGVVACIPRRKCVDVWVGLVGIDRRLRYQLGVHRVERSVERNVDRCLRSILMCHGWVRCLSVRGGRRGVRLVNCGWGNRVVEGSHVRLQRWPRLS